MGSLAKLCLLLFFIAIQLNMSSQQLTFARSWVRGEFANDEDGGSEDYEALKQSQNKKAKMFYLKSPTIWNPVVPKIPQSETIIGLPEENASRSQFGTWNYQFPHFYQYLRRSNLGRAQSM